MKRKSIRTSRGNVTLSFIPYGEIANLSSVSKIRRILDLCLENRILIIQGRLTPEEETSLIQSTMALVGRVKNFKGVEIAVISGSTRNESVMDRMKENLAKALVGDRGVITLIGPAAIVKEIKKDPKKIELLLK
ncbi:DUF2073 domain-containing protein [Candidatus Pacearchaeota archaeon]|nr:DUF2073 domain-containing protein [Candidatus Pacearchaeota archaeon]